MDQLFLPKKIYFKSGAMNVALRELTEVYHLKRALLVTDPNLYRCGIATQIDRQLQKQGLRTAEFFSIGSPPSFADIRSGVPKLLEFQPDVIVGVGGGSAMSAAKALWLSYECPALDLASAAAAPEQIRTGAKAKLALVATSFGSGFQNSPFAILRDDAGAVCVLKSFQLLPEISVTDSRFAETLSPDQVKACGLALLSQSIRAFAAPGCNEYTQGLLREAVHTVLTQMPAACAMRPEALEKLHNAGALMGAASGNVIDTLPVLPWPEENEPDTPRIVQLAEELGLPDSSALRRTCILTLTTVKSAGIR